MTDPSQTAQQPYRSDGNRPFSAVFRDLYGFISRFLNLYDIRSQADHASSYWRVDMNTWLGRVRTRLQMARTRAQLLNLTEEQLRDVGLTRQQAWQEASTPPWRGAPSGDATMNGQRLSMSAPPAVAGRR
jgi:uncharacterized protein YjiS (DUF1127 family)